MSEGERRTPYVSEVISVGLMMIGAMVYASTYALHISDPVSSFETIQRMCIVLVTGGVFGMFLNWIMRR